MELSWIGLALVFGLLAKRVRQAPLLGFLVAGFVLEAAGVEASDRLSHLADVGVYLLLFAIGLKLDLPALARPHVFAASLIHTALMVALGSAFALLGVTLAVAPFAGLSMEGVLLVGFFTTFSSTLFAVKVLEDRENLGALYGRVVIGFLVVQDLVAVLFLVLSKGEVPHWSALGLLALPLMRPVFARVLSYAGHRELLVLTGLALTLGGAALFDAVGLKADLGPLAVGAVVGGTPKSKELSEALVGLKDLFLVGFFLTIGLTGVPTLEDLGAALLLLLLLPLKAGLFVGLLSRFGLRARSTWLASVALTPYSEFGLVVAAVATQKGWLPESWLVTLAVTMGVSFVPFSALNDRALDLYRKYRGQLARLERARLIPEERAVVVGDATALVFGLGRVGGPAYRALHERLGPAVVAFDVDRDVVAAKAAKGHRVHLASATDADFWNRLEVDKQAVELVVLALGRLEESVAAVGQLRAEGYGGPIVAAAMYEDEERELRAAGADDVFLILKDAGPAFAERALHAASEVVARARAAPEEE